MWKSHREGLPEDLVHVAVGAVAREHHLNLPMTIPPMRRDLVQDSVRDDERVLVVDVDLLALHDLAVLVVTPTNLRDGELVVVQVGVVADDVEVPHLDVVDDRDGRGGWFRHGHGEQEGWWSCNEQEGVGARQAKSSFDPDSEEK